MKIKKRMDIEKGEKCLDFFWFLLLSFKPHRNYVGVSSSLVHKALVMRDLHGESL